MATSIGNIVVKVMADAKQFSSTMRPATTAMQKFGNATRVAGGILSTLAIGLTTAAVGGLVIMTKNELDLIDSTVKLGKVLGSSAVELEGLRLASQLGGSDVGQLDKGLKGLNKTIGETVAGLSTEGALAFEALGLSAEELSLVGTVEAFVMIAKALEKIENLSIRAGIVNKLFGRPGRELLITLQEVAANFESAKDQATAFGLAISDTVGKNVQDLNDDIVRLKTSFRGFGRTIAEILSTTGIASFLTKKVTRASIETAAAFGIDTRAREIAFEKSFGKPDSINILSQNIFIQQMTDLLLMLTSQNRKTGSLP